jgi:hypothetical protein
MIVSLVVELNLFEDAGLFVVLAVRSTNPHAHFGRSVAAQNRPVVNENSAGAVSCRSDGSTEAGHAAANDTNIDFMMFLIEMRNLRIAGGAHNRILLQSWLFEPANRRLSV